MQFTVSCEAFARMAEIGRYPVVDLEDEYKSLYFERRNNQLIMIACNKILAAIEQLGPNDGPDEFCCVDVRNDHLIKACDDATPYNGQLDIISNDALRWTSLKTNTGFNSPNVYISLHKDHKLHQWRTWFPDEMPKKTNGAMHWHAGIIHTLGTAAPSNILTFPEFIDVNLPIVVNDAHTDKWVALFLGVSAEGTATIPATMPDWVS